MSEKNEDIRAQEIVVTDTGGRVTIPVAWRKAMGIDDPAEDPAVAFDAAFNGKDTIILIRLQKGR